MYQVDKDKNRINKLMVRRFVDLGFGERTHLQEWLAHCPEALGEELLIIQKEFDGFMHRAAMRLRYFVIFSSRRFSS